MTVIGTFALHDLRFGDYLRDFDGVPTQLRGNEQELAPRETGSIGFLYAPEHGWQAAAHYAYTGDRFLNKRNTSRAEAFEVIDASVGYRFDHWEMHFAGYNLSDSRDPVTRPHFAEYLII